MMYPWADLPIAPVMLVFLTVCCCAVCPPGVWFAWSYIIGGAGTFGTFIFAALLRRSKIITTAELVELRYHGRSAAFLRGFKGVYFGILAIAISMGTIFSLFTNPSSMFGSGLRMVQIICGCLPRMMYPCCALPISPVMFICLTVRCWPVCVFDAGSA